MLAGYRMLVTEDLQSIGVTRVEDTSGLGRVKGLCYDGKTSSSTDSGVFQSQRQRLFQTRIQTSSLDPVRPQYLYRPSGQARYHF